MFVWLLPPRCEYISTSSIFSQSRLRPWEPLQSVCHAAAWVSHLTPPEHAAAAQLTAQISIWSFSYLWSQRSDRDVHSSSCARCYISAKKKKKPISQKSAVSGCEIIWLSVPMTPVFFFFFLTFNTALAMVWLHPHGGGMVLSLEDAAAEQRKNWAFFYIFLQDMWHEMFCGVSGDVQLARSSVRKSPYNISPTSNTMSLLYPVLLLLRASFFSSEKINRKSPQQQ